MIRWIQCAVLLAGLPGTAVPESAPATGSTMELTVTSTDDSGPGSLRWALSRALEYPDQSVHITFGNRNGLFSTPQTILLESTLPAIEGNVTIDGFIPNLLWKAYGATISGNNRARAIRVAPGGRLHLRGVTLRDGRADTGGAILNEGRLLVEGVTLMGNRAVADGGAMANQGGHIDVVNSTIVDNRAVRGGGIANPRGTVRVVHATIHDNRADIGAAVWSDDSLCLVNSILSGEPATETCRNTGSLDPESTHNLVQGGSNGCGEALLQTNPQLGKLGYYNGPTPTLPATGRSPVVNLGLNAAARHPGGEPLTWDQRGNGDPRFAAGYADLGAFERQSQLPSEFIVDMPVDNGLRVCTTSAREACPLRAALELAAAAREPVPVRFSPRVFSREWTLTLDRVPAGTDRPLVIDGSGASPITIRVPEPVPWKAVNGVSIEIETHQPPDSAH